MISILLLKKRFEKIVLYDSFERWRFIHAYSYAHIPWMQGPMIIFLIGSRITSQLLPGLLTGVIEESGDGIDRYGDVNPE
jgi:hypothetical protein